MSRQTQMDIPVTYSQGEETMHLFDAEAREEVALCGAETSADDWSSVQYYLKRRLNDFAVGTVCEPCKAPAVRRAERSCLNLEADAGELRATADRLETMATNSLAIAERCRRRTEEAEHEAERNRNGAARRNSQADHLEDEADECRRVADILARKFGGTIDDAR